jgi:transcriptional regulator with XRE-family HTH domain
MAKKKAFVEFGNEVRRRRLALNLTLEELAERAGLTSNYIGTIENGHRDPSLSTIQLIARGLGVSPGELFGTLPDLSPKAVEMGKLFDGAPRDVQSAVLMILRGVHAALPPEPAPRAPPRH